MFEASGVFVFVCVCECVGDGGQCGIVYQKYKNLNKMTIDIIRTLMFLHALNDILSKCVIWRKYEVQALLTT